MNMKINFFSNKFLIKNKFLIITSLSLLFILSWCNNQLWEYNKNNIKKEFNKKIEQIFNKDNQNSKKLNKNVENDLKWNEKIKNFLSAKHILYKIYNYQIPEKYKKTIYCWCKYYWKKVDLISCWLNTNKYSLRSKRIE